MRYTWLLVVFIFIPVVASAEINRVLTFGTLGEDVRELQEMLASDPSVYPEGQVTGFFGALTREAVRRFQIKHNIVTSGDEASTGFGVFGPRTRAMFLQAFRKGMISTTTDAVPDGRFSDWLLGQRANTQVATGTQSNDTEALIQALQARLASLTSQVTSLRQSSVQSSSTSGLGSQAFVSKAVTFVCKHGGTTFTEGQATSTTSCGVQLLGMSGAQCVTTEHICQGGRFVPVIPRSTISCVHEGQTYQHGATRYTAGSCLGSQAFCANAVAIQCRDGKWISESSSYPVVVGSVCTAGSAQREVDVPVNTARCSAGTCYYSSEPSTATLSCVGGVWTDPQAL